MIGLSDAQRIVYQRRLVEAEEAKHLIVTGKQVEQFVDQNGEQVRYTKANLGALIDYIAELERILNPALAHQRMRRPLGFLF